MYAIIAALNHEHIAHHPERINNLIRFIPKYTWGDIEFRAGKKEWKTFKRNNPDIALNILSVPYDEEDIVIQYRSKYNNERKNQVTLLMITDNKNNYHYLALKSIPTGNGYMKPTKSISKLFRDISSIHNGDVYCLNCLHSFRTNKKLKNHQCLCNDHDYCNVVMPEDGKNTLQYISGTKSLKMANVVYVDTESLLIKNDTCSNDPERCYTEQIATHEACGYSRVTTKSYDENTRNFYRGKDCIQKLCKELRDQATEINTTNL